MEKQQLMVRELFSSALASLASPTRMKAIDTQQRFTIASGDSQEGNRQSNKTGKQETGYGKWQGLVTHAPQQSVSTGQSLPVSSPLLPFFGKFR